MSWKMRSAPAMVAWIVLMMLASWAMGRVKLRIYCVKAWMSPTPMAPTSTCQAPTTQTAT